MLNKETTLAVADDGGVHAVLTIGLAEIRGDSVWGYTVENTWIHGSQLTLGSLSRIPYWGDNKATIERFTGGYENALVFTKDPGISMFTITRMDTEQPYVYKIIDGYNSSSDELLSWRNNIQEGDVIPLMFDPPPTGYL